MTVVPVPVVLSALHKCEIKAAETFVYSIEMSAEASVAAVGLHKFANERIKTDEGDIIRIDRNGDITRSQFEPKIYRSKYMSWYDDSPYYNMHEEILLAYCGCYGVDSEDVELLLEYGYRLMTHIKHRLYNI